MNNAFLIAAPTSGSGKTTVSRGLMALFTAKGYQVQPFKCGPDYIDTKFHEAVCGRPSVNLDTFMATPEHVRELFAHYGAPISRQQAQQIATQFLSGKSNAHRVPSTSEMLTEVVFNKTNAAGEPYLYAVRQRMPVPR